jgi:hypothetical protein
LRGLVERLGYGIVTEAAILEAGFSKAQVAAALRAWSDRKLRGIRWRESDKVQGREVMPVRPAAASKTA